MISRRIKLLSLLIKEDINGVFDVGSDHGYLLLLLKEKYPHISLCGVENKAGPYENLKKNTLGKGVKTMLSDGINDYDSSIYDAIVLAGMGYENIKKIILKDVSKIKNTKQIVIDSHNNISECRKFFIDLGFYIEDEIILKEDGIFYEIISFKKGNKKYSDFEIKYGPILLKKRDQELIDKLIENNKKLTKIIEILKNNDKDYQSLIEEIKLNEKVIRNEY